MYDLLIAVKHIVEKFIVNSTTLTASAYEGDTEITVLSSRRYRRNEPIVICQRTDSSSESDCEVHHVCSVPDNNTLVLDSPLVADYNIDQKECFTQKLIGIDEGNERPLEAVYVGGPEVIPFFPAITVNADSKSNQWFTLESVTSRYNITITVYVEAAMYAQQYSLMHYYSQAVENSLFRSFFPMVAYRSTTLAENVEESDDIIRVTDEDFFAWGLGHIYLEDLDFVRPNRVMEDLGNGVYQLQFPVGRNFNTSDTTVIAPTRNFYNCLPDSIQYGTVNANTVLKAAQISYSANEERRLGTPWLDPLTW